MKKTLIVLSHPNIKDSKANKALVESAKSVDGVSVRHLDSLYGSDFKKIDVKAEQEALLTHDRIIFQFPVFWVSTPAMLKAYIDNVLTPEFTVMNPQGSKLKGKEFKLVASFGGNEEEYQAGGFHQFTPSELFRPLQVGANFSQMQYSKPFLMFGLIQGKGDNIGQKANEYKELLKNEWK